MQGLRQNDRMACLDGGDGDGRGDMAFSGADSGSPTPERWLSNTGTMAQFGPEYS